MKRHTMNKRDFSSEYDIRDGTRTSGTNSADGLLARRLDLVMEYMLVMFLALMPMACGAVFAWAEEVVVVLSGAMLLCLLVKILVCPGTTVVWSWTLLPLGVFLLLVVFQLIPLPTGWVESISANTVTLRKELLSDIPWAANRTSMPLSLYSLATERQLRLALSVTAVFVVVLNLCRREDRIRRLLIAICFIGGATAVFQLAHVVTGTQRIFWIGPIARPGYVAFGGPFGGSYGSFSQFINLCLGAAVGLLFLHWARDWQMTGFRPADYFREAGQQRTWRRWGLITMMLLGTVSVFASRSRGGVIGMMSAVLLLFLLVLLYRRLRRATWTLFLVGAGVLICLLYVGIDMIWERLATLGEFSDAYRLRWHIFQDTFSAWQRFPIFGAGLGTHEMVFPMFSTVTITETVTHAENEYVQMLEETGLLGLGCILAFGGMILVLAVRCIHRPKPMIRIVAVGLVFGLVAVAVHSLSDFGLHKPANACLAAVYCALLTSLAGMRSMVLGREEHPARTGTHRRRRWWVVGVIVCVICAWGWSLRGADITRRAEAQWRHAETLRDSIHHKDWSATNPEYAELILAAQKASSLQPGNVEYRFWLDYFRWRSLSRIRLDSSQTIFVPTESIDHVRQIVENLTQTRILCPTYGPPVSLAGELELSVLGMKEGSVLIRRGQHLRPSDAVASFAVGALDALEGRWEDSLKSYSHAASIDPELFHSAAELYVLSLDQPNLAIRLAGENLGRLRAVMKLLQRRPEYASLAEETHKKIVEMLRRACLDPNASARELVQLANECHSQKQFNEATGYYQRALDMDYGNVYCRLRLAQALASLGRYTEAINEVELCLKLRPGWSQAEKLLDRLHDRKIRVGETR